MSYDGKMNFGLLGDFDAMPDLEVVADGINASLDELRAAAGIRKPRQRTARRSAQRQAGLSDRAPRPAARPARTVQAPTASAQTTHPWQS